MIDRRSFHVFQTRYNYLILANEVKHALPDHRRRSGRPG